MDKHEVQPCIYPPDSVILFAAVPKMLEAKLAIITVYSDFHAIDRKALA